MHCESVYCRWVWKSPVWLLHNGLVGIYLSPHMKETTERDRLHRVSIAGATIAHSLNSALNARHGQTKLCRATWFDVETATSRFYQSFRCISMYPYYHNDEIWWNVWRNMDQERIKINFWQQWFDHRKCSAQPRRLKFRVRRWAL